MTGILDEQLADKYVIKVLLNELKKRNQMTKILSDADGNKYLVTEYQLITEDEIDEKIHDLEVEIAELKQTLGQDDTPEQPAADEPQAPAVDENPLPEAAAPAPAPTPTEDYQPAEVETPQAPVEQPQVSQVEQPGEVQAPDPSAPAPAPVVLS